MKTIDTLYLFVHPVPRRADVRKIFMAKWRTLFDDVAGDESSAICVLSNEGHGMAELRDMAAAAFGDRCILDPRDDSDATKLIMADDVQRLFKHRGTKYEWLPYELWTSNMARRWSEGFKQSLAAAGYEYDPQTMRMLTCGMQWGGCLTKYAMLFAAYLELAQPADVRADLSPLAGHPLDATFVERVTLDHHVHVFFFTLADGRAMAQFTDAKRAVWDPPHVAHVPIEADRVELVCTTPNYALHPEGAGESIRGEPHVTVDVMDGMRAGAATLVAKGLDFDAFRDAVVKATVRPWDRRNRVTYQFARIDPMTMTPTSEA